MLGLCAFHAHLPDAEGPRRGAGSSGAAEDPRAAARSGARVWRRLVGGRALAGGDGFAIATLALPHRAALVGGGLRPEQVMNRNVRGLLAALRRLGIDPVYPGLDLVTESRRGLAHLGLTEREDGATLFQAVIAVSRPFSDTMALLDELDVAGLVPTNFIPADAATTVARSMPEGARGRAPDPLDEAAFAGLLADGYAATFGVTAKRVDPDAIDPPFPPPDVAESAGWPAAPPGAGTARAAGLLGPVTAWARVSGGRLVDAGLGGDVIAPPRVLEALADSLAGAGISSAEVAARVAGILDGDRAWILGLRPEALCDLLVAAAAAAESSGERP